MKTDLAIMPHAPYVLKKLEEPEVEIFFIFLNDLQKKQFSE